MPHEPTPQQVRALAQAETIAMSAKREAVERLVKECERSENPTLRSLASAYRIATTYWA